MSPAYIFTTNKQVNIMPLSKTNTQEENIENEQVTFEELDFEAEIEEEYKTITGKECRYEPDYEQFKNYELDVGLDIKGYPEVSIIHKKDKSYDALRVRVYDDPAEEILDAYLNFPKADENGYIENITKGFDFYRTCFDFLFSVLRCKGDKYVLDKNGEEYNKFKRVNLHQFAKYVDQQTTIRIKITEGNADSGYNSWEIIEME